MSHYAVAKLKIINPHPALFLKALKQMAEKLGGKVAENVVVQGWGFTKQCHYAILLKLPYGNGYGIEITSNGIKIHVDDHGAPLSARQFAKQLMKIYTAVALEHTLRELGYNVEKHNEGDKVIVYAYEGW